MKSEFGAARKLYVQNIHPRLIIGPRELAALRTETTRGVGRKILADMARHLTPACRAINDAPSDAEAVKVAAGAYFARTIWHFLDELAGWGQIAQQQAPIDAARRTLVAIAKTGLAGDAEHTGIGALSQVPFCYDLLHEHLSTEDRATVSRWMVELGIRAGLREVRKGYFRSTGVNSRLVVVITALLNLLATQGDEGVPDLSAEKAELILMLEATLHASHGENGYPIEDIGYGTGVSAYLAHVVEAAYRAGIFNGYQACPRYTKFGRSILHFVQPWGEHLTSTGDHYDVFIERSFVLGTLARMTGDRTLAWLAQTLSINKDPILPAETPLGSGRQLPASWLTLATLPPLLKPQHPRAADVPTAYVDRTRGIASFRSSWQDDALYVTLDGSHRSSSAAGHHQASAGHFCLSALGDYFGIDTGRYNMEQSCHSVVLIDGKSGRSTAGDWRQVNHAGVFTEFVPGAQVDVASVDSSHQHNCYWARRTLGLVKIKGATPYVWIVDDINKADDFADFTWQLHTSPENKIALHKQHATIRGWRRGNFLDVHFALPSVDAFPKPHTLTLSQDEAICSSTKYIANSYERARAYKRPSDMLHHSVFVRPRLLANISGYNGRFMSILLPRHKGEAPAKVSRLPSLDNTLAVKITFADVEDVLVWSFEHLLLEASTISARGNWCVERRSRATGKTLARIVG